MPFVVPLLLVAVVWAIWISHDREGSTRRSSLFGDSSLPVGTFFNRLDGGLYRIDDVSSETVKFARLWPDNDDRLLKILRQTGSAPEDGFGRRIVRVGERLVYLAMVPNRNGDPIPVSSPIFSSPLILEPNVLGGYDRIEFVRPPHEAARIIPLLHEHETNGGGPLPMIGTRVPEAWIPIDDPAFLDVMKQMDDHLDEASRILDDIIARHPKNSFYPVVALDFAVIQQDQPKLATLLDRYETLIRGSEHSYLSITPDYYREWLRNWNRSAKGENLWSVGLQMSSETGESGRVSVDVPNYHFPSRSEAPLTADLTQLVRTFQSARLSDTFFAFDRTLLFRDRKIASFLAFQVSAKMMGTLGDFRLFAGDPKGALQFELPCHRIGLVLTRDSIPIIGHLIGIALRSIAVWYLNNVYLDGTADAATLRELWLALDEAYAVDLDVTRHHVVRELDDPLFRVTPGEGEDNLLEFHIRGIIAHARLALLHTGVAARYHRMATGSYPASIRDFGPLLPGGPDPDPFTDYKEPLRTAQWPKGTFILYSLGPDREDQSATVEYDPTNGTLSAGDLSIEVPPTRTYPFPPPGGLATTRDGILAQFPNGLPPDRFADRRPSGYAITDTHPAWILSWGPDTDQKSRADRNNPLQSSDHPAPPTFGVSTWEDQFLIYPRLIPHSPYDPTNGVVSRGDLYFSTAAPHATMLQGNLPPTPTPFVE